jgi:hypothetical protein
MFPRDDEITLADKNVELDMKLGETRIRRKFSLKQMVFEGELRL